MLNVPAPGSRTFTVKLSSALSPPGSVALNVTIASAACTASGTSVAMLPAKFTETTSS